MIYLPPLALMMKPSCNWTPLVCNFHIPQG
ncbi:hypothetical protein ID866_13403 [Astraeus odoratus]|nr:hypothetical protein ID866_13403 [Astraeus odoratus]